jgi:hypothetical protein
MERRLRSVTYASGCGAGPTIRTRLRQCLDVIDPNPLQVGGINLHGDNPAGLRTPILPIQTESDSVCHEVERHIHLHVVRRVPRYLHFEREAAFPRLVPDEHAIRQNLRSSRQGGTFKFWRFAQAQLRDKYKHERTDQES